MGTGKERLVYGVVVIIGADGEGPRTAQNSGRKISECLLSDAVAHSCYLRIFIPISSLVLAMAQNRQRYIKEVFGGINLPRHPRKPIFNVAYEFFAFLFKSGCQALGPDVLLCIAGKLRDSVYRRLELMNVFEKLFVVDWKQVVVDSRGNLLHLGERLPNFFHGSIPLSL